MRLISVTIPSYNHARYVRRAIRSVLEQDYADIELIVVDDGSRDTSHEVIRDAISDTAGRRVIFETQENAGAHAAITRGLALSRGDVLSILNSDDHYEPNRFACIMQTAPARGDFIAFSQLRFIDDHGRPVAADSPIQSWYDRALRDAARCPTVGYALLRNNFSVTSGNLVFTRGLYQRVGCFNSYRMCHDWDFLLRATHFTEPLYVQQVLMAYRYHEQNTLRQTQDLLKKEGVPALNTYIRMGLESQPPNGLAPGWVHWPEYFEFFIRNFSCWFSPEPMDRFISSRPEPNVASAKPSSLCHWREADRLGLPQMHFLTSPAPALDAFAFAREAEIAGAFPAAVEATLEESPASGAERQVARSARPRRSFTAKLFDRIGWQR
jgi:glycosyltransferase involved in cell wall biosynthesis